MINKVSIHANICKQLNDIYERKNADYGDAFAKSMSEYGMAMPAIRLEDKLNRFKALTVHNKSPRVSDESVEDTLMDMANYAIMTILELRLNKEENNNG